MLSIRQLNYRGLVGQAEPDLQSEEPNLDVSLLEFKVRNQSDMNST